MRALQPNEDYGPSESNCRFCKLAPTCPALHQVATDIVSQDFDPLPAEALTDDQLAKVVEMKPLIEQWLRAVYKHAVDRTERGNPLPGFKLVHGRSQRKWADDAEDKLAEFLGDKAFDKKLIGITAAEKIVGKAVVDSLTTKPPGAPTLVPLDDKRPAIDIAGDFEKLEKD